MRSKYRDLVEASERLCRTPIVDNDFPEMQHRFHGALREARAELDALQADAREKGEAEPESRCREDDGCPTELAVLQRYWRATQPAQASEKDNG